MLALAAAVLGSASQAIKPNATVDAPRGVIRRITWEDAAPIHDRLQSQGITSAGFPQFVERVHASNLQRVHEGDLDHLVFYALQSTHFTGLPPVEPALSAKALVDSLNVTERETFLRDGKTTSLRIPPAAKARLGAMIQALQRGSTDARLAYSRPRGSQLRPGGA